MRTTDLPFVLLLSILAVGCDKTEATEAKAEGAVEARYTVKAENLDLEAVVAVVERSDVRDAESVEALLNAEDSPIQLDVDEDGQRDFISVREVAEVRTAPSNTDAKVEASENIEVEVEDGATARFEILVIPSSTKKVDEVEVVVAQEAEAEAVVVATLDFKVDVKAEAVIVEAAYAPVVIIAADSEIEPVYVHEIHIHGHHDHHIVVAAPFVAWVWLGARPVYVGHYHLPPGHAKHLGLHWHGHHGHHGHGNVHVHGGPSKTHVKVKSGGHGGGGHTHVKVKSGSGGGAHVKVKSKGGGGGGGKGKGK